ncbi:MAG: tripartite tricarboxylate transporter substrate binding protein [Rubrivivax sp.]
MGRGEGGRRRALTAITALAAAFLTPLAAAPAFAQATWPDKPLRVVLPFPPGGPSDMVMRLAAEKMQAALKQTIVIENRPGAGGNLGTAEVARAAPDGSTWLWGTDTLVTVNPHVYRQLGFKADDLVPVTVGTTFSQTLVCNPAVGVKTVAELAAKAKTTKLSYASGGNGVPGHLSMELLLHMAGFEMAHVPYRPGTGDAGRHRRPGALRPARRPHGAAARARRAAGAGRLRRQPLAHAARGADGGRSWCGGLSRRLRAGDVCAEGHARSDRRALPASARRCAEEPGRGRS